MRVSGQLYRILHLNQIPYLLDYLIGGFHLQNDSYTCLNQSCIILLYDVFSSPKQPKNLDPSYDGSRFMRLFWRKNSSYC